jgi:MscS family membrane protein
MAFESILSESYFGSTVPQYLLFFAVVAVGAVLGRSLSFLYKRRLRRTAEATETQLDDIILHALGGPVVLLGVILSVAIGREVLTPVEPIRSVLGASVQIPVIVAIAWIAVRLTDGIIDQYVMTYAEATESKLDDELVPIVSRVTNIAIVSIAGVVIMDAVGYDVTAIIASLGVGGIAIAFASRKTMADVFGGAHLLTTKPFVVDDMVEINGTAGTVEEIGLRSTRIRDFDGREISMPNATIADSEVKNISSEPKRKTTTYIGLTYETSPDEMDRAIALAADTAAAVDGVDAEQTGAWFWDYEERSMRVRLDYFIEDLDRLKEVRDEVNSKLQQAFDEADLNVGLAPGRLSMPAGAA